MRGWCKSIVVVPLAGILCYCAVLSLVAGVTNAQETSSDELIPFIMTLLEDPDKEMRALGFEQIRTAAPGSATTLKFAALLPQLKPEVQVGLLTALGERGDVAARDTVLAVLTPAATDGGAKDAAVELAAIQALGFLGDTRDVPRLVGLLETGTDAQKGAAQASLIRLGGDSTPDAIVERVGKVPNSVGVRLLDILTTRRSLGTIPAILQFTISDDVTLRKAAMQSLGQMAGPPHLAGMVQGVLAAKPGSERDAAEKAIMQVCAQETDPDKRADPLLVVAQQLPPADRIMLLPTLGRVGGTKVAERLESALADKTTHDTALRAFCNWPDASQSHRLTELAASDPHPEHRTTALRALIRVAPLADARSDQDRLALLQKSMTLCTRDNERHLVLKRLQAVRIVESLSFATEYLQQPAHAQAACETVVELAHHRKLRETNKPAFDAALDQVIAIAKDPILVERAQRYKEGRTWTGPARTGSDS